MDIQKLKDALEIAKLLGGECTNKPAGDGRPVIVRSRDAGVIFGNYAGHEPNGTVHLTNARQLWKWHAAQGGTLIDVAVHGVVASKCKFSPSNATLTVFNACALIDCSPESAKQLTTIEAGKWA